MTKNDLLKKILDAAGLKGTARTAQRNKLKELTNEQLKAVLAKATAQQTKQQKPKSTRKSKPKTQAKQQAKQTKSRSRRSQAVAKSVKKRAGQIQRAIQAGKIMAINGINKPSDLEGNARDRYAAFNDLYKGVRVSRKTKQAKVSIKDVYAAIAGKEGTSKFPYYLSQGYHVHAFNVGGGRGGPGMIRTIPGSGAPSFASLDAKKQEKVVAFLNSDKGSVLRGPGMSGKSVSKAAMQQAKAQAKAKRKSRKKKATAQAGAANRWW